MRLRARSTTLALCVFLCFRGVFLFAEETESEEISAEEVAALYEAQWRDVNALRIEFKRETRTRTATCVFDDCSWEIVGAKAKVLEARILSFPLDPTKPDSKIATANVVSECFYDGDKTRELTEPISLWPLSEVKTSDYERLRRQGGRATISNRYKHWRFWYFCPVPRYFSIPTEDEALSLTELVKKYKASVPKRSRSERGEELVQLEIRNENAGGNRGKLFKSWTLYVSLNADKNFAISGYQLVITLSGEPEEKIITEYTAVSFKEFPHGIWLPTECEYREHSSGMRSSLTKMAIRGVSINVPSDDFEQFHFLPGMVVREEIWHGEGFDERPEIIVHLWGDDDKSDRDFASEEEFDKYYVETFGVDPYDGEATRYKLLGHRGNAFLFVGSCVCLAAFVGLVLYTRRAVEDESEEGDASP